MSQYIVVTYVQYAVNASSHDYYGKATGAGAVAIWTQYVKSIEILDYQSQYGTRKATKFGAGNSVMEALTAANAQKLVIVGGNDRTVGFVDILKAVDMGISQDAFFEVIETLIRTLITLVDAGGVSVWLMTNSSFAMTPASRLGLAKSELSEIMRPTIMKLEENHVTHTYFVDEFPTFLDAFKLVNPPNPVDNIRIGGRFIPRSLVESSNGSQKLMAAIQYISNKVGAISGIALNASVKTV